MYNFEQTTVSQTGRLGHHRRITGTDTVTESVVLPPFYGRGRYAPIHAVCSFDAPTLASPGDRRYYGSPRGMVVFALVYLAGLRWNLIVCDRRNVSPVRCRSEGQS